MTTITATSISPYLDLAEISAAQSTVPHRGQFKKFRCLTNAQKDPARLLPPTAPDDLSSQQKEIAEVRNLVRRRTPERFSQTAWEARHEDPSFLTATLGSVFNLKAAASPPLRWYPSGHTNLACSVGGPIAELIPEKAQAILAGVAHLSEK